MSSKPFRIVLILVSTLACAGSAAARAPELSYYLPEAATYDPSVPEPAAVLGWEVGTWHARHDQLVAYMRLLAERSDRVSIEVTGKTHEERPLLLLTISSPRNLERIEEIREAHVALADPSAEKPDTASMPVVVYLGYSIHGNEASGSNAALLVAYHLAAARGGEVEAWLDDAVVLLDPSLNPDGLSRFAQWANMHRGQVLVADPNHREHDEGWPSGRTNHYWFDLNRDWLPLVHPESRARLASFHRWKPNVLIDAHEMGTGQTFFFQPGIETRKNPLTPAKNLELTHKIARYHAEALDAIGSLYYSEEDFDDYYYGKGSSYPDVNGTVGILFEQASARGHVQESDNGDVTLPFAVRNHFTASLSTLRASLALRQELLDYQADFYRGALEKARADAVRGYVFGDPHDPVRTALFRELLDRHRIAVYALARPVEAGGTRFEPGWAYVAPLVQAQYFLVRAFFEKRVSFEDSTFYDVSTWTLPLAYDLPHAELGKAFSEALLGEAVEPSGIPGGAFERPEGRVVAYAFPWSSYFAARTLHRLLAAEVRCRVATQPFRAVTPAGDRELGYGTIVVPLSIQDVERSEVEAILEEGARRDGVEVVAVSTGLTPEGVDIGSPSLEPLELPEIALLAGAGASAYEVGEIWHLVDQRFEMPISLVDGDRFGRVDLDEYTHLILVDGDYDRLPKRDTERLADWIRQGGVLVTTKRAAEWAAELGREKKGSGKGSDRDGEAARDGDEKEEKAEDQKEGTERLPYAEARKRREAEMISGAIFQVELDVTHPLAYGYRRPQLAVFRNSTIFLEPEENPFVTVAQYSDSPLLSGYVSGDNLSKLGGTPAVIVERMGEGVVVRMVDDPAFRGFWYGTDRLVMNALFFGPIVDRTPEP